MTYANKKSTWKGNLPSNITRDRRNSISNMSIFKYCQACLIERSQEVHFISKLGEVKG